jgi:hypothetical protein
MKNPCTESWDAMPGDQKTRFCDKCGEDVYDLSERTEEESVALYADRGAKKLCVRYAKDSTGAILFKAAAVAAMVSVAGCSAAVPEAPAATPVEVDRDFGDGVLDTVDRCPDTPTEPGKTYDDGCPDIDPDAAPKPPAAAAPDAGHD